MSKKRNYGEGSIVEERRGNRTFYRGYCYDKDGNRLSKGSYTKSVVVDWLNTTIYEIKNNIYVGGNNLTFGEFLLNWLETYKKPIVSGQTYEKYTRHYHLRTVDYDIDNVKLKDLDPLVAQKHVNAMLEKNSLNLVKDWLSLIGSMIDYAIHNDFMIKNPFWGVNLPQEKRKAARDIKTYTRLEQKTMLEHLSGQDYGNYCIPLVQDTMIILGFQTGMRVSEIIGLKWEDLRGQEIQVKRQYLYVPVEFDENGKVLRREYMYCPLKTVNAYRTLPLPDLTYKKLIHLRQLQNIHKMEFRQVYDNDKDSIFCDELGEPIRRNRANRHLAKISRELGLAELSFHALRHSYATRLFENDIAVKTVQTLLGHANIEETMDIYTHVTDDVRSQAVKTLNIL